MVETQNTQNEDAEYGRIKRREIILMAHNDPDPERPENPFFFRYYDNTDLDFLRSVYPDKIADGTFDRNTLVKASYLALKRFADAIDYPKTVNPQTYDNAVDLMRKLRDQNPRFLELPDSKLTALIRSRIKSSIRSSDEASDESEANNNGKPHTRGLRPSNGNRPEGYVSPEMQRRRKKYGTAYGERVMFVLIPGNEVEISALIPKQVNET